MYTPDPENTGGAGGGITQQVGDTLMIRRCARCRRLFAPLTIECSVCASDSLDWVPSSGAGSILSWRVVDRSAVDDGPLRLTIAIVELDDGPWVYTSIEGDIPAAPDHPVRVRFQPKPREDRFPVFTVSTDTEIAAARCGTGNGVGEH